MVALASVEYWCSDLSWCFSSKQSIFSNQFRMPSFSINWPSLVSTTRSPFILWRLRSHKPLHKHDSNKYQLSKPSVISATTKFRWDQICDACKQSIPCFIDVSSAKSNQHYPHRTNQKLCSWANAVFQNREVCGQVFPSFPSPPPSFIFFCSCPNFLDEYAQKCLLRRLLQLESLTLLTANVSKDYIAARQWLNPSFLYCKINWRHHSNNDNTSFSSKNMWFVFFKNSVILCTLVILLPSFDTP